MIEFENYIEPEYRINNDEKDVIVGQTEIMLDLFHYLNHLASLPTTILLRGETGTGKELCAKALHYNGKTERKKYNFVAVNCAGIPSELLESELFGYMKGSFTGAYKAGDGKFQYAHKGTILLDEIGDMTPKLQTKVLRVLQDRKVTKIGSNTPEDIDVRIIAATNKNLEEEVKKGNFREDLYYRLNVVPVKLPVLGERKDDIPVIAQHFINKYNNIYDTNIEGLSNDAEQKLKWAEWKGNVRELENIIERVFVFKEKGIIGEKDLFFNSDMPRKVYALKKQEEPEKEIKKIEKKWYENGVFPVAPRQLNLFEGAKPYHQIMQIADYDDKCAMRFGSAKTRTSPLIFLTWETVEMYFQNKSTKDYENLIEKIKQDEFNEFVHQPFTLLSISELIDKSELFMSYQPTKWTLDQVKAYKVSAGMSNRFVINYENVKYFMVSKDSVNSKNNDLMVSIDDFYDKFVNMK